MCEPSSSIVVHGEVVPRLHHLPAQLSQAGDQGLLPGQRHLVHRDALPKVTLSKFTVRSETSCMYVVIKRNVVNIFVGRQS